MSNLCSHRRGRGFCAFSFAALVFTITGLVLAVLYPVSASPAPSLPTLPKQQGEWPAVGVGAGYMRFEHLGIQDGLSDNAVMAVLQDSLGFMWFGTREGLNRYDGYEFTVYSAELDGPDSLSDSTVTALAETPSGTLWVGTQDGGLNRFDSKTRTFTQINLKNDPESMSDTQVNALQVDSLGRLWIATPDGLRRLDPENGSVSIFQSDPGDAGSLSDDDILSLFEDEAGRLWIGTANGLNLYENNNSFTRNLTDVASDVSSITAVSSDGEGGLWLGSEGGLLHFDPERESTRVFRHNPNAPDYLSSNRISALFRDSSGRLWIGYEDQGIDLVTEYTGNEISVESFEHQSFDPQSLSHNAVRAISEDEGGLLWFGTHGGGVNKANPATRAFGYYLSDPDNANSPAGGNVTALAFDASRRSLWIGTADNGLDQMNLITGEFKHYQHDPEDVNSLDSDQVTLLHIGPQGNLFVETQAGVLEYYDPAVDGFLPALTNLTGYRSGSHTTAITHNPQGTLWLSQSSRQLLRVDPDSEVVIRYDLASYASEPIQDLLITDIHADPAGILWLATDNLGLVRFDQDQGTFTILSTRGDGSGPSHDTLTNIYPGRDGVLWLGTEGGGLNKYEVDTGDFTYFTIEDGLPSNRVYGILEDDLGNLWLSTGNGLVRFDPVTGSIEKFDVSDGLQGNTFNPHAHAAGNRGALFFGGVEGFNAFYPAMIEKNDHSPQVVITEVSLFNRILTRNITGCDASLTLTHDQNFLSFEFTALDFASPDNNQYAYRMDGLDEDFVQSGNKRSADYPNLAWGTYTFRLIGSNNDGLWNTEETCLLIDIQAPFWARWWFILLVGLFLAGAVILGYQWRIRAMEKNRENLAIQVFERTMEIERRRQMASGLGEVIRLINTNQPLGKSLDYIVHQCVGLTSAEKAAIFERVGDQVVARACYPHGETYPVDLTDPESSSARCLLETTLLNRLLIFSRLDPDTMKSDTSWELVSGDYRTVLCTPVLVEDEVYGGLVLYYGDDRTFTPEEINLAHTLADQASLAIANERLKNEAQEAAVIGERNRLARDLHDAVSQTLFSTSLIAEVLPKIWEKDPEKAQHRLDELRHLTRGALGEMRTLLMELRPSALREADPAELFKHLTDAFTGRTGVPVELSITGTADCKLSEEAKLVFYRIAQEGLNNVAKHAEAGQVWFRFNCSSEVVTLTISDDGRGFDKASVPPGHLGLGIMQERAESIGAELTLVSQLDEGTTLRLTWQPTQDAIK